MHNHLLYIALGSNTGNRLEYLQKAISHIELELGLVSNCGNIYEVPAVGFNGNDFLNTCIQVYTRKTAQESIAILQRIEKSIGRTPKKGVAYEDRVIDLDILYYDDLIINTVELQVPHPRMEQRYFVMKPLSDIAPHVIHPISKKNTAEVCDTLLTNGTLTEHRLKISKDHYPIHTFNFIAIEGNIGSGKTSLTHMLSKDFNGKRILERFEDNPFLPLFYKDQERYSFPLEMSFLADRYQQLSEQVAQQDLFADFTIADYYVIKSLIFSKVTLQEVEYQLYQRLFHLMYKELVKPELYVYLYQNEERLLANIKKRGREYEQDIKASYLSKIQQGYMDFIKTQTDLNVMIIDVTNLDFVNNQKDYVNILQQINDRLAVH
jgi:2-amino-4-hydroxy-6-hydroxymethyldihydropteridine diphosphokinase